LYSSTPKKGFVSVHGSSHTQFGGTMVICGVIALVGVPSTMIPDCGDLGILVLFYIYP